MRQLQTITPLMAIDGTPGDDTLLGTSGDDDLFGYAGNDRLDGAGGSDALIGDAGDDSLLGGAGDDLYLYPGSGNDVVAGGIGFDRLYYDEDFGADLVGAPVRGVLVDLTLGTASDGWGGTDTLSGIEFVRGSALDDTLTGADSTEVIEGGAGNDVITGANTDNTLDGQSGNDSLRGRGGGDTLLGRDGNDTLIGGAGDDYYLYPGSGDDRVDGGPGFDRLYYDENFGIDPAGAPFKGALVDLPRGVAIDGWGGRDSVSGIEFLGGSDLDDTLTGADATAAIEGGAGNDVITGAATDNTLDGQAGNDSLRGGGGSDTLLGRDGNDTLIGGAGDDLYLYPGSGDDLVNGGAGFDRLFYDTDFGEDPAGAPSGGVRVDLLAGAATDGWGGSDTVSGVEYVRGSALGDTLLGGSAGDLLEGREGDDVMNGRGGNDTLDGFSGNDDLSGGAGADLLLGDAGDDTLAGGDGNDRLYPGSGDDVVNGGAGIDLAIFDGSYGDDLAGPPGTGLSIDLSTGTVTDPWGGSDRLSGIEQIVGTPLDDRITGDGADNQLEGAGGDDFLDGAGGSDTASYAGAEGAVTVDLARLDAQETGGAGTDTLKGIENLSGGAFGDTLVGDAGDNLLDGSAGSDTLRGGEGNDTYFVDEASDEVFESPVATSAAMPIALALPSAPVTEGAGSNIDTVISQVSYTLRANVENLQLAGTAKLDGTGNELDNLLRGNRADNRLTGLAGRDVLDGAEGNDTLQGGSGNDTLGGGAGVDSLSGGEGKDALIGGAGADHFVFDVAVIAADRDTIADFQTGQDRIVLSRQVFGDMPAGVLADSQFRLGNSAQDADDRLLYDRATGILYYDADGNGALAAVEVAQLGDTSTHPVLVAADILIG